MTANSFKELQESKEIYAIKNIDSKTRYYIVVKFTENGFKMTKIELAGGDNAEGDAVFPPARKAKKKAKKTTAEET